MSKVLDLQMMSTGKPTDQAWSTVSLYHCRTDAWSSFSVYNCGPAV